MNNMRVQHLTAFLGPMIALLLLPFPVGSDSITKTDKTDRDSKRFVHPGILHTAADLERMRMRVTAGAQPYLDGFKRLQSHPQSSGDYVVRGGFEETGRKPSTKSAEHESDANATGGYIHAMHRSRWGGYHYRITGKKADGEVAYEGGWQNNRQMGMHRDYRMVENIFEELDAPGEWFHDATAQTLYYQPEPDTDLTKAKIEVVRLRHLVEFKGSEASPVRFITLRGFVVRHAARTFMDTKEPLLRSGCRPTMEARRDFAIRGGHADSCLDHQGRGYRHDPGQHAVDVRGE